MIDYRTTLCVFFQEVIKYLEKRLACATDEFALKSVKNTIRIVKIISENTKKYSDYVVRVNAGLEENVIDGFMAGTQDNSVFLAYNRVLHAMGNLDSEFSWKRLEAQSVLLESMKQVKYKNTENILKDFYFPFLSPKKFAIKSKQEKQK